MSVAMGTYLLRRGRWHHSLCAALLAVAALLFGTAAPAHATVSHTLSGTFGEASSTPSNPYPLSGPTDVSVDQETHDVYVADTGNYRIEKFNSAGHFILMFGEDVNKTAVETPGREAEQNVCPAAGHPSDVCQAGTPSSAAGGFEDPTSLAVDNYPHGEGDVYVGDAADGLVQKFYSSGQIITSWGSDGQKDGSDSKFSYFGNVHAVAVGGGCDTPANPIYKVCEPNGTLYLDGEHYFAGDQYTQGGTFIKWDYLGQYWGPLKANSEGDIYAAGGPIYDFVPGLGTEEMGAVQATTESSTSGFGLDPSDSDIYQDVSGSTIYHYGDCVPPLNGGPCSPEDSFGSGDLSGAEGVEVDDTSHTVYVANTGDNDVVTFADIRPQVTTGPFTEATENSVTLTGHVDPLGHGNITSCYFEWGIGKSYGHSTPCTPDAATSNYTEPTNVTATLTGFSPGTKDHYRLVAASATSAKSRGEDRVFFTTQPPAIDGLAAANLAATSADLNGEINPNGLETEYRFEYGSTLSYGQSVPVPNGMLSPANSDQPVEVHLGGLVPHVVYHYRLVAINPDGTTVTPDHTFNFYPPPCPNENVRQQVEANFLPDCRAYELVSPGNAGGTQLYPDGPNTGYATNPPRFSFVGLWSTIPNSGGSPIDGNGDLYVATRTDTGWVTKYVGLPSSEAAIDGGPPMGPPNSAPGPFGTGLYPNQSSSSTFADKIQNNVLTDPEMNKFVDWTDGPPDPSEDPNAIASNAPYVWSAEGALLDRWPTNLATVPAGVNPDIGNEPSPGGLHALDCPKALYYYCPGDVTASSDLSHFIFASEWNVFAPGGQLGAPGSVYDNNTATGEVVVASKTSSGNDIPSQPTDGSGDPLQIPAVSSNGSHLLIAAAGLGPCGSASCGFPPCGNPGGISTRCPMQPSNLYMRVDDAVTYDVSQGHDVKYVGMTADGSKVYFTSEEQLTPDDTDSSTDLYMWSESTNSLTLISKGSGESGNGNECSVSFVSGCGVVPYSDASYCTLNSGEGGNCHSDSSIASENGDIYFFSPEQLDGSRGIPNEENLYVYRNDHDQYVTTFTSGSFCFPSPTVGFSDSACSDTPIVRMEVTPEDGHMAFVTASPVTQYENDGHLEMYIYDPSAQTITCASCIPSGAPPTSEVGASQDGLFMTNDGRVFFTTSDALVHGDTNEGLDVYEYVDGRAQLITTGTGETRKPGGLFGNLLNSPGLLGVSANGQDVYFSTYDTLTKQDHNGLFLKIYDAREDGGFSAGEESAPCQAADECHDAGSPPPPPLPSGTGASLGSGGTLKASHRTKSRTSKRRRRRNRGTDGARHGHRSGHIGRRP